MNEVWKEVYEKYLVSDCGNVKSLMSGKEKTLTLRKHFKGYLEVHFRVNGKAKVFKVHRLVAEAFIPNPKNLPEINHKDKDRTNNHVSNLEWCTSEYNVKYSKAKKVIQYDLDGNFIKEWDCIRDVKRKLNIDPTDICNCCKGKRKTAKGYKWKYKD